MKDILNCKYQVKISSDVTQCMTLQEYRVYETTDKPINFDWISVVGAGLINVVLFIIVLKAIKHSYV